MSGNPVSELLGRGSIYSAATTLQLGSAVLVLPIVTRLLSTHDYGTVTLAFVVQALLGLVGALGFPEVIPRTIFSAVDGAEQARTLLAATALAAGMAVAIASLAGPWWCPAILKQPFGAAMLIGVLAGLPQALLASAQAILRSHDRAHEFVAVTAVATVGAQVVGLLCLLISRTAAAYLVGTTASLAVASVAASLLSLRTSWPRLDGNALRDALGVSLATVPHGLAIYLLWAGDRAVIAHILGATAAGRYQVAYTVGGLPIMFVSAAYNAWGPIIFRSSEQARWTTLAVTTAALYRVTALIAACTALGAAVVLPYLVPRRYDPSGLVSVSAVVALGAVPFVLYCAAVTTVLWRGKTLAMAAITPAVAAANLALNVVLLRRFGLIGAAWATLAAYALQAILMLSAARLFAPIRPQPGRLAWAAAVAGLGALISVDLPRGGSWLLLRFVLFAATGAYLVRSSRRLMRFTAG